MRGTAAFADLLDAELRGFTDSPGGRDAWFEPRYTPPHPLLFTTMYWPFRASPYRTIPRDESTAHSARPQEPAATPPRPGGSTHRRPATPRSAEAPPRPRRALSGRQQQALAAFVGLGAQLTADFTADELRRAYRKLALEYHPDRHPGCTEPQKTRLTRILADLNEHHRHLLATLRPAA